MTLRVALARLPDIDSGSGLARHGLTAYGRFAILRDGSFWFAGLASSHPRDCAVGWYWAVTQEGGLLVSARGAAAEGRSLFGERRPVLALLVEELVARRTIPRPDAISLR